MDSSWHKNQIEILLTFVIFHLYCADSKATVMKHTLISLGMVLALIILLGLLTYGLKRW